MEHREAGCRIPWGHEESDATERLNNSSGDADTGEERVGRTERQHGNTHVARYTTDQPVGICCLTEGAQTQCSVRTT